MIGMCFLADQECSWNVCLDVGLRVVEYLQRRALQLLHAPLQVLVELHQLGVHFCYLEFVIIISTFDDRRFKLAVATT